MGKLKRKEAYSAFIAAGEHIDTCIDELVKLAGGTEEHKGGIKAPALVPGIFGALPGRAARRIRGSRYSRVQAIR